MTDTETIIVGAGISGIACAQTLLENNVRFKIISPDVGGRMITSLDGSTSYGAYYILGCNKNILPYISITRKIDPFKIQFNHSSSSYSLLNKRLYLHLPELVKLLSILFKFKSHYLKLQQCCCFRSQKECLEDDHYLMDLYRTDAEEFIRSKKIINLTGDYLSQIIHGSAFTSISDLNAFSFLILCLPVIVPIYEFTFNKEKVIKSIDSHLMNTTVVSITKKDGYHVIRTKDDKKISCKNIVIAVSPDKLGSITNTGFMLRGPVNAHMFHISGQLRSKWDKAQINLFDEENDTLAIAKQSDATYIFYSRISDPKFTIFFSTFKIISHKYWDPAFNIKGNSILDFTFKDNIHIVGDNNICTLEDSLIYGVFAGRYIIAKRTEI